MQQQNIINYPQLIADKMIEMESQTKKTSQYRNMQIVTVVQEMLSGIWQNSVITLINKQKQSQVSNDYSNRIRAQFIPFVFQSEINTSLVICESRHMNIYSTLIQDYNIKSIFITSSKQLKTITVEQIAQYDVVFAIALVIKDIAKLLDQSVKECVTNTEEQSYNTLISNLIQSQNQSNLTTVLNQLKTPGKQPTFVVTEARSAGIVFQRVIIDPSSLNSIKHEVLGKYLWIASTAFEFSPTQHSGVFWKTIRKFLPNKQYIQDINTRLEKIIVKNSQILLNPITEYIYAKKKIKLPNVMLPPRMQPLQFINTYEIVSYNVYTPELIEQVIKEIVTRFNKHGWLAKSSLLVPMVFKERITQQCILCYRDETPIHSILLPCCVQCICFDCFYILLKQGLKCPMCRSAYVSEGNFSLLSIVNKQNNPNTQILQQRSAILKQLNDNKKQFAVILDTDDNIQTNIYKIAQSICSNVQSNLPIAICQEEGNAQNIDNIKALIIQACQ